MAATFSKYTELKRTSRCEKHGAYEEIGTMLSILNRTIWYGCNRCGTELRTAEESRRSAEFERNRQHRIEQRLKIAGIPRRFIDRNFHSFFADTKEKLFALKIASDFAANFAENSNDGNSLIFSGRHGTGKTHLAVAVGLAVMVHSTVIYVNALDLIRMVRDTWRRGSPLTELDVLNDLSSVGLLIVDEVGVQYGTEGEKVILFDVINRRYRDSKPMILLTNLNRDGMKDFLGDRSFDRLREIGTWVIFDWTSYRGANRRGQS
ncbi:ATP-binding protein [Burkholderia sp. Bp8991]|uniref:ATP-binding protein n=1 Tax=Burkholderia sp. Bp8991 TaxID=2184553 RepID=UPI000F5A887C|nr:ATP-binding protein [Burkholderia sp. Bp8991]RQR98587.1 DNA replication protein DnaC [Burkholderia sp. Bp8991]